MAVSTGAPDVLAELDAEGADLDTLVAGLAAADWRTPTPAAGWTIAHQIGHLTWTDRVAVTAVTDAAGFTELLTSAAADPTGFVDRAAAELAATPPPELLAAWRSGRAELHAALAAAGPDARVPWFGPPMRATSMATARLMETWAHGCDVADALGVHRPATARLRSVAHLGVRTRDFAFTLHGRTPPAEPFRVELRGPAGEVWTWGPDTAAQRVQGGAVDFCLLVTQRRARADLDLTATGPDAQAWLQIAQAFAGPPGPGR